MHTLLGKAWKTEFLALVLVGIVYTPPTIAQTSTGEIEMTVLDPSGGVVPNAKITITGTDTGNIARVLRSNAEGFAAATLLRPLAYTITVNAPGFRELVEPRVVLRVGDTLKLQLAVQPGQVTEKVTVVGESPLIEQNTDAAAQVITSSQLSPTFAVGAVVGG